MNTDIIRLSYNERTGLEEDCLGQYVRWEDYRDLRAQYAQAQDELDIMTDQRDAALMTLGMAGDRHERELAAVTKQRDGLAEALRELRRWVADGDLSDDSGIWPGYATTAYKDSIRKVDEALAAVEGGQGE